MTAKSRYNTVIFPHIPMMTSRHGKLSVLLVIREEKTPADFPLEGPVILIRVLINYVVYSKQVVEQKVKLPVILGAIDATVCSQNTPIAVSFVSLSLLIFLTLPLFCLIQ